MTFLFSHKFKVYDFKHEKAPNQFTMELKKCCSETIIVKNLPSNFRAKYTNDSCRIDQILERILLTYLSRIVYEQMF